VQILKEAAFHRVDGNIESLRDLLERALGKVSRLLARHADFLRDVAQRVGPALRDVTCARVRARE
jgi:hypothetical protein